MTTKKSPVHNVFAGFDGGGTRTTCVLSDSEGCVIGVGSGGRSNYHDIGLREALASLKRSFEGALERSGLRDESLSVEACFGLAGLDSTKDMARMKRGIGQISLISGGGRGREREERIDLVENDWRTAVTGAFVDEPGVTLIAGTGCVAAAQSRGGSEVVRVGGWGHIVDDRGSAYDIGRDALYAAMRDYDGRGPKTMLLKLVMQKLAVDEPQGIIARVYAEGMSVSEIASLSTLLSEAADRGDEVALHVLLEKGRTLGDLVVAAASKLKMLDGTFGVSFNGGVFEAGHPLIGPLEQTIHASAPHAVLVEPKLPPACGAIVMLMRRRGREVDDQVVFRLSSSLEREVARGRRRRGASSSRGESA